MRHAKRFYLPVILFLFLSQISFAQSDTISLEVRGYVKYLSGAYHSSFFPEDEPYVLDHLIHQRLDADLNLTRGFRLVGGLRTRFFWGDFVKADDQYGQRIKEASNDHFDLSVNLIDDSGVLLNSYLDRFYLQYNWKDLEVTLGRQRVNWGIQTFWNPNDIFNTYNFVDFDYEERPGSDALNLTYYRGYSGQIDLAVKYFDDWDRSVVAARYKFAVGAYDVQLLAGKFEKDVVVGGGWAGNLGNAGFKGEFSYFRNGGEESFSASTGWDYLFSNGLYLGNGLLYNSLGSSSGSLLQLVNFELSAKNLYPYTWSTYLSTSYAIDGLSNAGLTFVYSPIETHPLFTVLTVSHSMAMNWDLDLTSQLAFDSSLDSFKLTSAAVFLRVRYSF